MSPEPVLQDDAHEGILYWGDCVVFLATAFCGVLAAAGLFAVIQAVGLTGGNSIGVILAMPFVGFFVAMLVGIPVFTTAFLVAWCCWLTRWPLAVVIVAGGLAGLACGSVAYNDALTHGYRASQVCASLMGAAGAAHAGQWCLRSSNIGQRYLEGVKRQSPTFTLSQMFWHFTVLTALIGFWICLLKSADFSGLGVQ